MFPRKVTFEQKRLNESSLGKEDESKNIPGSVPVPSQGGGVSC